MTRTLLLLGLLASLAACGDGQPLFPDEDPDGPVTPGPGPDVPPGTDNPTTSSSINRYEARDDAGGGYAEDVSYDEVTDTFTVDNLAFDGENVYQRDNTVPTLDSNPGRAGAFQVYEADAIVEDPTDGQQVDQFLYRAIVGRSLNEQNGEPRTEFAIVRTGSFTDYGFGGFVYAREGGVELPTSGQAVYDGEYAGLRVFTNRSGIEYTTGDVQIQVDFEDFNDGEGVRGTISNRRAYDMDGTLAEGFVPTVYDADGNPITQRIDNGNLVLPDLTFAVAPGVLIPSGEIATELRSRGVTEEGEEVTYESGNFYAIMAGTDDGDEETEIVGIFVITSEDPRFENVTAQETGGFIVYR
jgi:predicted small lipoprotein YifL